MLDYLVEYLKPWPTMSESGASNKIVNATKTLKAKRRKDGSIIFVVGKSPIDIMEPILCRKKVP